MPDAIDLLDDNYTAGWRDVAATMAHAFAGDTDRVSGDLSRAMATIIGKMAPDEVSRMVADIHSQELAGEEFADSLVPLMSVTRLMDTVTAVDIAILKRAIAAVCTIGALHAMLFVQSLHEMVRREAGSTALDDLLPEHLTRFPDDLAGLRAHPAYLWLSGLSPQTRRFPASVTLLSIQLAGAPTMLQVVENYRDRLTAALEPTEANQRDTLRHLGNVIASR